MGEVTKETMMTCEALDERDFLKKKINNLIKSTSFIGVKRKRDENVSCIESVNSSSDCSKKVDEFNNDALSTYQSINDLISRYRRLDKAILIANATVEIETRSGVKMTRAEAINLRKSLKADTQFGVDFDGLLLRHLKYQYDLAMASVSKLNLKADLQAEKYKEGFVSRDNAKLNDDDANAIEKLTADLYGELVDPIGLDKVIKSREDSYSKLITELESAIKISNATTTIEF